MLVLRLKNGMEAQSTEGSTGARVPSFGDVKSEWSFSEEECGTGPANWEADKDFLCPICIQTMKDAFLTACGHSFCYTCIMTHLNNKNNCPCCGLYLTNNQLFPNFLLNKLLKKASACHLVNNASPTDHLKLALQQGAEVSVKELDCLLSLLTEKKRKVEQEEAETNMEILLNFLHRLRQQKQEELNELQGDLQFIKEDIVAVERQRQQLMRAKERYSLKLRMLMDGPSPSFNYAAVGNFSSGAAASVSCGGQYGATVGIVHKKVESKEKTGSTSNHKSSDQHGGAANDLTNLSPSAGLMLSRRRRVLAQFGDLQDCYLQKRRTASALWHKPFDNILKSEKDGNGLGGERYDAGRREGYDAGRREGYDAGLEEFQTILSAFIRHSRLRVIAELQHRDLFHSSNIVSSIEFDRDDELFATAGVSRRIKIFDYAAVVNEVADTHCPVVEMPTRSKLSCLSWNKYIKNYIASSDYEGYVTVWDVNNCQSIMEYEEHEKRAWSVDFSRTEPLMLVSGSDDGKVKIWCTKQETSVLNIDLKANVCCVKYNPGSSNFVAVGSADHHIHYYDLRNITAPLHVFIGHCKTVSYVKFISPDELASASTDSTLRLWDVKQNSLIRTLKGHANEKNFVGLTVNSEYVACGSETNEVFVYHKAISKAAACHRFGSTDMDDSDDDTADFISAVCWKSDSPTLLAANSRGTIKVLVLAP